MRKLSNLRVTLWKYLHYHWNGIFAEGRTGVIYCKRRHTTIRKNNQGEN